MKPAETTVPLYTLRPTYVPDILKLETLFYAFLLVFGLTIIGGMLIMLLTIILGLGGIIPFWLGFFAILVASAILIPPYVSKTLKANLAATACKFYDDHMLYQTFQWMIFRRRGRIKYSHIADIAERTNIFQARYNVGDIWVIVPGMNLEAGQRFPGLKIRNIRLNGELTDFFERVIFHNNNIKTTSGQLPETAEEPVLEQNLDLSELLFGDDHIRIAKFESGIDNGGQPPFDQNNQRPLIRFDILL